MEEGVRARVGYLGDEILYADLRERLAGYVTLVDLAHRDRARVAERVPELDVVLHHPLFEFDAGLMHAGDRLRAVLAPGAGYNGIDIEAASSRGILVSHHPGCNDEAVAEHAIGLMLAVSKRIAEGDRLMRRTADWSLGDMNNHEIGGKTLGVVGFGAIGRRLSEIASGGFRMRVLAFDPYVEQAPDAVEMTDLPTLLSSSDIVSVHAPLTPSTRGMIGAEQLALMRANAILINTARGFIVDQGALTEALRARRIAGAGLDVFDHDVLPPDHPILELDTVVVTPHCAGATHESLQIQARRQAQAVLAIVRGEPPRTARVLNPTALASFVARFGPRGT